MLDQARKPANLLGETSQQAQMHSYEMTQLQHPCSLPGLGCESVLPAIGNKSCLGRVTRAVKREGHGSWTMMRQFWAEGQHQCQDCCDRDQYLQC
jgi:hypothetical protein